MANDVISLLKIGFQIDDKTLNKEVSAVIKETGKTAQGEIDKFGKLDFSKSLIGKVDETLALLKGKLKKADLSPILTEMLEKTFSTSSLKEKEQAILSLVEKVELLSNAVGRMGNTSLVGFNQREINAVINAQKKIEEKEKKYTAKRSELVSSASRVRATKDIGKLEKMYSANDSSSLETQSKITEKIQEAVSKKGKINQETSTEIQNLGRCLSLYTSMESAKPERGTKEAVRYAKEVWYLYEKIVESAKKIDSSTGNKAALNYVHDNYKSMNNLQENSWKVLAEDYGKKNTSDMAERLQQELNKRDAYIQEIAQKHINQANSTLKENSGKIKTGENNGKEGSGGDEVPDPGNAVKGYSTLDEALKVVIKDFKDVEKYAVDAKTAFEKVKQLIKEYDKNGMLSSDKQKDFFGYQSRFNALNEVDGLTDGLAFSDKQEDIMFEMSEIFSATEISKARTTDLYNRVLKLTDAQIAKQKELEEQIKKTNNEKNKQPKINNGENPNEKNTKIDENPNDGQANAPAVVNSETIELLEKEAQNLKSVAEKASEAAEAKKLFSDENKNVKEAAEKSAVELEKEAKFLESIAGNAEKAAAAKERYSTAVQNTPKDTSPNRKFVNESEYMSNPGQYSKTALAIPALKDAEVLKNTIGTEFTNGFVKVSAKIKEADGNWKQFSARIDGDGEVFNAKFSPITNNIEKLNAELTDMGSRATQQSEPFNFEPNTAGFKEIVNLLGIAKNEALNIKQIVKETHANGAEFYNVKYNDGSSVRYGADNNVHSAFESIVNDTPELLEQQKTFETLVARIKEYSALKIKAAKNSATEAEKNRIIELEKEINKLHNNPILSESQFTAAKEELQKIKEQIELIEQSTSEKSGLKRGKIISDYLSSVGSDEAYVNRTKKPAENMTGGEALRIRTLAEAFQKYKEALIKLEGKPIVSEEQLQSVEGLRKKFLAAKDAYKQLEKADRGAAAVSVSKLVNNIDKYLVKNSAIASKYRAELIALKKEALDRGAGANIADIQSRFEKLQVKIRGAGQEGKRFFDIIKEKATYGLAGQLAMYFNFQSVLNQFRQGIQTVKELDTALTEMRKVSDETLSSLKRYQKESFQIADDVATTAQQIIKSTADWQRLGESLSDAKESAKVSNILFNVSEFENIDEATDSLVSLSAAYKDLEKIEIVDSLNKIGNEYSISTDQLATALKDSASSLTTAGNSFAEAIALTTAGNAITQDASKTGSGLRTIALRLTGTEAAREALNELGEDTSDFITASKLRQTIKQATAAATNDGSGFDILDSNGNYKSTYQMMLGLSELYDKIQQKDKEMGTNNLNLLLETIAGKNRSNIAASILQNPDMLKSVYEGAQNADGSAQEELNKHIDSIEAKFTKLQNQAQRFWYTFIGSDDVKKVTVFLTDVLSRITDIVDKIGSIPALLATIGTAMAIKNVGKTKSCLHIYAYSDKVSHAKCEFYILPSVKYTVEIADMASRCIWTHPLVIEGREVA